jgi:hypothetical protein
MTVTVIVHTQFKNVATGRGLETHDLELINFIRSIPL